MRQLDRIIDAFAGAVGSLDAGDALVVSVGALGLLVLLLPFYRGAPPSVIGEKTPFAKRFATLAIFVLVAAVVAYQQVGSIKDKKAREWKLLQDTLYLPGPATVSRVALGYDEPLASLLFLRSIQAYGGGWQFDGKGGRPKLFKHYFNVITDLDPKFTKAYTFGNMMVGEESRAPGAGLALMVKGLHHHPTEHQIPYEAAFFAQDRLKDYERAVKYFKVATQPQRHAPSWVERQLNYFAIKSGQFRGGIEYFLDLYLRSIDVKSEVERNIAALRLRITQNDWGRDLIERALEEYREKRGGYPINLEPLLDTETLADYEFVLTDRLIPVDGGLPLVQDEAFVDIGKKLYDQREKFQQALFGRIQRKIPPTYDFRLHMRPDGRGNLNSGWRYQLKPTEEGSAFGKIVTKPYKLIPASDDPMFATAQELELQLSYASTTHCMPPPNEIVMRQWLGYRMNRERPVPPDDEGSFYFYNAVTGEGDYASRYMGVAKP